MALGGRPRLSVRTEDLLVLPIQWNCQGEEASTLNPFEESQDAVDVPFRVVNGRMQFLLSPGVALPEWPEGMIGTLTIPDDVLGYARLLDWFRSEPAVVILPKGAELLLGVNAEGVPPVYRNRTRCLKVGDLLRQSAPGPRLRVCHSSRAARAATALGRQPRTLWLSLLRPCAGGGGGEHQSRLYPHLSGV